MSMLVSFVHASNAAPPVVTGVTASQRTGTKIVDISYNLQLDAGQSAFVELWFSPDNGLTYPIRCLDVQGAVDSNITGGNGKSVEWNAESDWDQKFTSAGKIRVIATYGDEPSGFGGSGSGGSSGGNSGSHDASMKPIPMTFWVLDFNGIDNTWVDLSSEFEYASPGSTGMVLDTKEVTNGLWDEVVEWASQNNTGYTGLALKGGDPDLPVSNVNYWEAIKWCNARSEKDGLTPAYYTDGTEALGDINNNGEVDTGLDIWDPITYFDHDPNNNGVWDAGEPFKDNDNDGVFNPKEYEDYNGNGQYDSGLTQVFRQGSVITDYNSDGFVKKDCNGYRLPMFQTFQAAATGGNFKKSWPWGNESFPGSGGFAGSEKSISEIQINYNVSSSESPSTAATPAADREPNGYEIYDLLGNVAEFDEHLIPMDLGGAPGDSEPQISVFGGSYLGIGEAGVGFSNDAGGAVGSNIPSSLLNAYLSGSPEAKSTAVGFRCVVYLR